MQYSRFLRTWILPSLLVLSIGWVYYSTLAPGLSWANDGADGGDFISAAVTGGVPHPTGYPTYILLARLFQFLPFGSLAFRTNLLSAVFAVLTALLVYGLVISLPYGHAQGKYLGGLIAAFAYGLSPLVWSQAVITEVYSLNVFFFVAILFLLLPDASALPFKPGTLNRLRGLLLGLAMGNHITTVALLPPVLLIGSFKRIIDSNVAEAPSKNNHALLRRWRVDWKALVIKVIWFVVGLCIYFVLPLRAVARPPINWGDPVTLKNFIWLVSGHLYGNLVFTISKVTMLTRLGNWARFLVEQCGIAGLIIGLVGLFFCRPLPLRIRLISGWILIVFSVFSIGYNSYDSTVLLMPVSLIIALWVGLGSLLLMKIIGRQRQWLGLVAGVLILAYLASRIPSTLPKVDASGDQRAELFGERAMDVAPPNALIFTSGDKDTFAIWYFHFALHQRPDISVLVTGLLPFEWYRDTLRSTYPSLIVPDNMDIGWGGTMIKANPGRPVCYTDSLGDAVITCP